MKLFKTRVITGASMLALLMSLATSGYAIEHDIEFTEDLLMPTGKHYEAEVPGTLDLAERAKLSVHGLTSFLNPKQNYAPFGQCYFNVDPPYMTQINGSPGRPNWGKITDGMVMARIMSGSDFNLNIQAKSFEGMMEYESAAGSVPTARNMMALMSLYDQNPTPELKETIDRLADSILAYAKTEGGYTFVYNEPPKMDATKLGVIGHGWVAFIHGSLMRALCRWGTQTGQDKYIEMAGKFKDFLMQPQFWNPETEPRTVAGEEHAHFMGHHHSFTAGLMGLLWYADAADDTRVMQFVRDGYEYMRNFGLSRIGLYGEGCTVGDMTFLAIKMSDMGIGDYWEDVDQYVRNHLTELQMRDAEKILAAAKGDPYLHRRDAEKGGQKIRKRGEELAPIDPVVEDDDRVAERNVGAILSDAGYPTYVPKRRFLWTICCTGNCTSALYQAWESIVRFDDGVAQVNLLLNRVSPWLDIDSYLPYEGKVVIRNKQAKKLSIRIPRWVDETAIQCQVNGKSTLPFMVHRYLVFDGLKKNDAITIEFPMVESIETWTLKWKDTDFWMESTFPGPDWEAKEKPDKFTMRFRGNTLVEIKPEYMGESYKLYQREHLKKTRVPMKKVTRFETPVVVNW